VCVPDALVTIGVCATKGGSSMNCNESQSWPGINHKSKPATGRLMELRMKDVEPRDSVEEEFVLWSGD